MTHAPAGTRPGSRSAIGDGSAELSPPPASLEDSVASRFWSGHRLLAGPVLALVGTIAGLGRVSKSASLLHASLARLLGQGRP
jgi:hypothetical protein